MVGSNHIGLKGIIGINHCAHHVGLGSKVENKIAALDRFVHFDRSAQVPGDEFKARVIQMPGDIFHSAPAQVVKQGYLAVRQGQ
jgi:disulfide bond formation protein DsbB